MATMDRNYVAERFSLNIQGKNCGFLQSVEGGNISAEVVQESAGNDHFIKKHISQPKFEDLAIQTNLSLDKQFYDWIAATWNGKYIRKDVAIFTLDREMQVTGEGNFFNAQIIETTIPAMDSSSTESCCMTVKIRSEYSRTRTSSGTPRGNINKANEALWRSSNFRLDINGLECRRVTKVDTFTVKQPLETSAIGENRIDINEPGKIDFPNLKITLAERDAQTWIDWHEDFVIKGNNAERMEKNGSLIFLSTNYRTELGHINFFNLGIFRLLPEKSQIQRGQLRNLIVELYCERMEFVFPGTPIVLNSPGPVVTSTTEVFNGLGITRESIQVPFEKVGFTFDAPEIGAGQIIVRGKVALLSTGVAIIGEADDIQQTSLSMVVTALESREPAQGLMLFLLELTVPGWSERIVWVNESMDALVDLLETGNASWERTIIINNREVVVDLMRVGVSILETLSGEGIMVTLTIKAS